MSDEDAASKGRGILHPEGMQATRDIAGGVVHEINNILGVIIGNAHLARKNASDPAAIEKYLGEVRNAAEEGRELMRDLAAFTTDNPIQTRVLSLNDLVRNAVSDLEVATTLDLSTRDPVARLNLWLAQDALGRLIRFMASTKTVGSIRIATRVVGSAAVLTIEDDGVSPSEQDLRTLFTPFAKIDRRPNAKLGLAKIADLAFRSDGFVTAGVREPQGLRVVLTLPVDEDAPSGDGPGVSLPQQGV
jgi:signal transduction histidine kinase